MEIGIPRETKNNEFRVALIPDDVAKLVKTGPKVYVERSAGAGSSFLDREYEKAGANIGDNVYDCKMIVRVKEPPLDTIKEKQTMMAYLHIEKGQNPEVLNKLKEKRVLSYAYEEIKDERGERLVNLGFEAGIVGVVEGFRILGKIFQKNKMGNPFKGLLPVAEHRDKKEIYSEVAKLNLKNNINIVIMGKGRVSSGVQDLLRQTNIKPTVLRRSETPNIEKYLPNVDILVNAVDWYPGEPRILKKSMLKLMKERALIVDISCDKNGAIETCIPATWGNPTYEIEGITHFCVDNLPSAIPRDASIHLSNMILPQVMKVANGEELKTGMMTKNGEFVYKKI